MSFVYVDQLVYGPAIGPKDVWTDLNLAAHIEGADKTVLAFLKINTETSSGFQYSYNFRTKGDSGNFRRNTTNKTHGTSIVNGTTPDIVRLIAVFTNSDGVVEWQEERAGGGFNVTIEFYGYEEGFTTSNTEIHNGTPPSSFTVKDISSVVGVQSVMAFCRLEAGGSGINRLVDFVPTDFSLLGAVGAGGHTAYIGINRARTVLFSTDENGQFKWKFNGTTETYVLDLLYYFEGNKWEGGRQTLFDDGAGGYQTPPTTDTIIDLSSIVGNNRVTVLLEVAADPGGSSGLIFGFKPGDEPGNWLTTSNAMSGMATVASVNDQASYYWVQTSDVGQISWKAANTNADVKVSLLGYAPPAGAAVDSVVHTYLNLRVNFAGPMKDDAELRNPANYNIVVTDPTTAYDFGATDVIPEEGATNPSYVDLTMSDCTGGKEYSLSIVEDKLQDIEDNLLGSNLTTFTGVTEDPDVLAVESISLTEMRVVFSKIMAVNEELKDPSNYSFTGGLQILKVTPESSSSVILTTTTQTPAEIYDLTVS